MNLFDMISKSYSEIRSKLELPIQGTAAHDAAAVGNPVQVGGVYRIADPAVADGDAVSLRVNAKGEVITQLSGSNIADGTASTASLIEDTNGYGLQRGVIDANWPYNKDSDTLSTQLVTGYAIAKEKVTVSNSSKALTTATIANATHALITFESAEIRYWFDGSAPTTTDGHLSYVGKELHLDNALDIANFRAIRTASTDGVIQVTYSL